MSIPDNRNFGLSDVVREIYGSRISGKSLRNCFADAISSRFDPAYSGNKDRLSNFRNYGSVIYYSAAIAEYYTKNDCQSGYSGSQVYVSVGYGAYTSQISQANADAQAQNYAQAFANANGTCTMIVTYWNEEITCSASKNDCGTGYHGSETFTGTISAGSISSTESQAAANALAEAQCSADIQAYANAHGTCVLNQIIA